jgi:hypothetical protein
MYGPVLGPTMGTEAKADRSLGPQWVLKLKRTGPWAYNGYLSYSGPVLGPTMGTEAKADRSLGPQWVLKLPRTGPGAHNGY